MATDKRVFTMRMQPENFDKIRVIAAINKRSVAMQIEYLIERCIANYESKHGQIPLAGGEETTHKNKNTAIVQANIGGNGGTYNMITTA